MDMMDDEDLKKSVIDRMMGELDDVTSDSLKKAPAGPVKGVEIAITVSPKSDDPPEEMSEGGEACPVCEEFGCANPDHAQIAGEGDLPKSEDQNYIQQLLNQLDDDKR